MAKYVSRKTVTYTTLICSALSIGVAVFISPQVFSGHCSSEAFWCPFQKLGDNSIGDNWDQTEDDTTQAFTDNFNQYFSSLQDDTSRRIQGNSLSADSIKQSQIDVENRYNLNKYAAPADRCKTEDINSAIPQVERNVEILAAAFNQELVERAEKGIDRSVALIKADVEASEGEAALFEGNDSITGILYPKGLVYTSKQQKQAAKSYVDRLVFPVWPPSIPKSQVNSNKGVLYKKQRLDFISKVQLIQHTFAQLMAENEVQQGLLELLKRDIEADGADTLKLLQDREGVSLEQASANTLIRFEIERRLMPSWQKKQEDKNSDAVWREIINLRNITLWLNNRQRIQDQRIELLYATMLAYENTTTGKERLEALYSNL